MKSTLAVMIKYLPKPILLTLDIGSLSSSPHLQKMSTKPETLLTSLLALVISTTLRRIHFVYIEELMG